MEIEPVGYDSETYFGEPMTLQFCSRTDQAIVAVTDYTAEKEFLKLCDAFSHNDKLTVIAGHHLPFDLLSAFPQRMEAFLNGHFSFTSRGWEISGAYGRPSFVKLSKGHKRILIIDTARFTRAGTPLARIARDFCPDLPKLGMPKALGSRRYSVHNKAFRLYAIRDAEIALAFLEIIIQWHQLYDIPMSLTAPHMAAQVFKRHFVQEAIPLPPRSICWASLRSFHGGIQRAHTYPAFFRNVQCLDIVSAYPYAMTKMPSFTNPKLYRTIKVTGTPASVPQFSVLKITGSMKSTHYPALFQSKKFAPVSGEFETHCTGSELNIALALKQVRIKTIEGYYYDAEKDNRHAPMRAFIETMFKQKQKAQETGNKVEREAAKLLMNALYGKFIQTRVELEPYYDVEQDTFIYDTSIRAGGLFNPFIATNITGYTRAMLTGLEQKHFAVHSATDSIICSARNAPKLSDNKLGALTLEAEGDALIVRPKCYIIYTKEKKYAERDRADNPIKSRLSGLWIRKHALHGFRGSVSEMEDMLSQGKRTYTYTHAIGLKESFKTSLGRANNFIEREGTLNYDDPD